MVRFEHTFSFTGGTTTAAQPVHSVGAYLALLFPVLASGTVAVQVSNDGTNFFGLADASWTGTGSFGATVLVGGFKFVRLSSSVAQTADITARFLEV